MKKRVTWLLALMIAASMLPLSLPVLAAEEPVTLTWFRGNLGDCIIQSYNDNVTLQKIQEIVGVKIDYQHSAANQLGEQISLMVASLDMPDIIEGFDDGYKKGGDAAIDEGLIYRLNELIDEHAPDYRAVLDANPEAYRQVTTDSGNTWAFSCLQPKEEPAWRGPSLRYDLLEKTGLELPKTIGDLEAILYAFRDMGVEIPLYTNPVDNAADDGFILAAFDIGSKWFMKPDESGKQVMHYYLMEDGYRDYLELMNKWYNEGLLDKEFATREGSNAEAMATQGNVGVYASGGGYGPTLRVQTNARANGLTDFTLELFPNLPLEEGGTVQYRNANQINKGNNTVITTMCDHPDLAAKFLNFGYSEEGAMMYNYGLEGLTYEMVNGEPKFTELITNNPDGLGWVNIRDAYKMHTGPYLRDWAAFPATEFELHCMDVWTQAGSAYVNPPLSRTAEESTKFANIMNDIDTYRKEMIVGFVSGTASLDTFDAFRNTLLSMGMQEAIDIQQAALDRYYAR